MGIYTKEDCLREIESISVATSDIKDAIRDKGVSVPDDAPLYQYGGFIREIETGGGSDLPEFARITGLTLSFDESTNYEDVNAFIQNPDNIDMLRDCTFEGNIEGAIGFNQDGYIGLEGVYSLILCVDNTLQNYGGWISSGRKAFTITLPYISNYIGPGEIVMWWETWDFLKEIVQNADNEGIHIVARNEMTGAKESLISVMENPEFMLISPKCGEEEGGEEELDWTFTSEVVESDSWYDEEGDTYGAFIEARSFLEIDTPVFFGTEEQYKALPGYISKPPISDVTFLPMPTIELADGTSLIVTGTDLEGAEIQVKSYKYGNSIYSENTPSEEYNQGDAFSDMDGMYRFAGVIGPFEEYELSDPWEMFSNTNVYNYNSQPRPNWSRGFDVDMFSLEDAGFTDIRIEFNPIFKITLGDKTMTTDFGGSYKFDVHFPLE